MRIIRGQAYLTTGEAAQMLGVSSRTMLRWCSEGTQDFKSMVIKDPTGRMLIRKDDMETLLNTYFPSSERGRADVPARITEARPRHKAA